MTTLASLGRSRALARFGKGDERKLKSYMLMMAAFLEAKPQGTKDAYQTSLNQFFGLFEWLCPEDVTIAHAAAFKKWLIERKKVSDTTAYARMSACSSFFNFLCYPPSGSDKPLLTSNPFSFVSRSDIKPTPYAKSRPLEWKTLNAILDALPNNVIGLRDRAILLFFAFTSRRRSEVARLRVGDLLLTRQPASYTIKVKGGAIKTFELPDICLAGIRAYWTAADRLRNLQPESAVFACAPNCHLTKHLDPEQTMSPRMMNFILQRAALRAGVDMDGVKVHAIRHLAARSLDEAGVRLQDIQEFLAHASPVTTQIYTRKLAGPTSAHTEVLLEARAKATKLAHDLFPTPE
jgi:site-specific recombinase XerD